MSANSLDCTHTTGLRLAVFYVAVIGCLGWMPATFALGQADTSPEAIREEAMSAFDQGQWEVAHRRLAELLSLDGTDVFLQMRYAATLLHDARLREEGIQRLAALADANKLQGEGWYWWGRAWMLQGEPELAESALLKALDQADKKAGWRDACSHALAQSRALPVTFPERQALRKLDAVDVPASSFHRYVQWERDGVRIMLAPKEIQSKLDKKSGVQSPVSFWRGEAELFYHSLGSKGSSGLDVHVATLDESKSFGDAVSLPDHVNSPWDEVNPVWDPSSQCLVFGSNRPGTVGGFDLFQTCREKGSWSTPKSLGPMFNSVHNELAYYPAGLGVSGWLVTGRQAAYGGVEVWEVELDGAPMVPVQLSTQWSVAGEAIPGTLRLSDAQSNQALAKVELDKERGQWSLVVGAGQVLRYEFTAYDGTTMEGTYAVPEADAPSLVTQNMVMTWVDGSPFLDARPLTQEAQPNPDLTWGWDVVHDQINTLVMEDWTPPMDKEVVQEATPASTKRKVIQFQSYPLWTEVQKEERAIAANVLSKHVTLAESGLPPAEEHATPSAFNKALEQAQKDLFSDAVMSVLSVAAKDVLLEEKPWEEALSEALDRAAALWPVGTLNLQEVGRKAQRLWARSGSLYDRGALPEVRNKQAVVGNGDWIEAPWRDGRVAALAEQWNQFERLDAPSAKLIWALANHPEVRSTWNDAWVKTETWNADAFRDSLEMIAARSDREAMGQTLSEIRTRLSILETIEPFGAWTAEDQMEAIREWKGMAMVAASHESTWGNGAPSGDSDVAHHVEDPATVVPAEGASQPAHPTMDHSKGTVGLTSNSEEPDEGNPWMTSLDEEWRSMWQDWQSNLDPLQPASGMAVVDRVDAASAWRDEWTTWISARLEDGGGMRPEALLKAAIQFVQKEAAQSSTENTSLEPAPHEIDLEMNKARTAMLAALEAGVRRASNAREATPWLEAAWVIASWESMPGWRSRSPEQIQAMVGEWPPVAERQLSELRVAWAQSVQRQLDAAPSAPDSEVPQDHVMDAPDHAEATPVVEGAHGVHLGWFRNPPQLELLPKGTKLEQESGQNGLSRWVLVLPEKASPREIQAIESWLMRQGVLDAYDVRRGADGWTAKTTEQANPTSSNQVVETPARNPDQEQHPGASNQSAAMAQQEWGADEVWTHGAPVALGDLRGTWYAVQVGAFRGVPEKPWIEKAGERLVYEPFPDGLARWYAGVRQDQAASEARKEELRAYPAFSDAFVVRLRNGVREAVLSDEGDVDVERVTVENGVQVHAKEEDAATVSEVAPDVSVDVPSNEDVTSTTRDLRGAETQASPALVAGDLKGVVPVLRWHIDIAKYYGTVPSEDVASLLFKAADWGVRSVQLFGQTTYFTRSLSDLGEAERLLEAIRSEGFPNATLVQEKGSGQ